MNIEETVAASRASQNKTELRQLLKFVSTVEPKIVVEIGIHKGYSLLDWYRAFKPAVIIGVDIDITQLDQEALNEIRAGCELSIISGDSTKEEIQKEVVKILNGKKIDFLYIDGDHTYEAVKSDFEYYSHFVRTGGVVGFDDMMLTDPKYQPAVDVNRFWLELNQKEGTSSFVFWDEAKLSGFGTGIGVWIRPESGLL